MVWLGVLGCGGGGYRAAAQGGGGDGANLRTSTCGEREGGDGGRVRRVAARTLRRGYVPLSERAVVCA